MSHNHHDLNFTNVNNIYQTILNQIKSNQIKSSLNLIWYNSNSKIFDLEPNQIKSYILWFGPNWIESCWNSIWFDSLQTLPLPPHTKSLEATLFFPYIVKKTEEIIIKDRQSVKILFAVLRNCIGAMSWNLCMKQ